MCAVPWKSFSKSKEEDVQKSIFVCPERASFLAKNSETPGETSVRLSEGLPEKVRSRLGIGKEHHDFAALLPTLLALRSSCLS